MMELPSCQILQGDVLLRLSELPDESVDCCVTSPPYWGLRDYGVAGQIGLEKTPEEYVRRLVDVFREVRRVLRNDGTLWLNLGDCYFGSWGNYGGQNRGNGTQRAINTGSLVQHTAYEGIEDMRPPTASNHATLKSKDLVGIPWRVAFALQADGWWLRSDIIWHKPNPMPESVQDRPTKAHEYVFLLSKSGKYFYDGEAIQEDAQPAKRCGRNSRADNDRDPKHGTRKQDAVEKMTYKGFNDRYFGKFSNQDPQNGGRRILESVKRARESTGEHDACFGLKRNKRSVWMVATVPYPEAHFAVYPPELIRPCIRAGCRPRGVVLDPFFGSGTTGEVALEEGRSCIGIELSPEYCRLAEKRLMKSSVRQGRLFS